MKLNLSTYAFLLCRVNVVAPLTLIEIYNFLVFNGNL